MYVVYFVRKQLETGAEHDINDDHSWVCITVPTLQEENSVWQKDSLVHILIISSLVPQCKHTRIPEIFQLWNLRVYVEVNFW
jgi:hypothetical protein